MQQEDSIFAGGDDDIITLNSGDDDTVFDKHHMAGTTSIYVPFILVSAEGNFIKK
jgi:hypothetical protein